jgi:hypothetical protein
MESTTETTCVYAMGLPVRVCDRVKKPLPTGKAGELVLDLKRVCMEGWGKTEKSETVTCQLMGSILSHCCNYVQVGVFQTQGCLAKQSFGSYVEQRAAGYAAEAEAAGLAEE